MQENKSSKCHIGFILSILCPAIFLCLLAFAVLVPYLEDLLFGYIRIMPVGLVVALVLSIIGVKEAKKYNLEGKGLGIAGIIISLVSLLIFHASTPDQATVTLSNSGLTILVLRRMDK